MFSMYGSENDALRTLGPLSQAQPQIRHRQDWTVRVLLIKITLTVWRGWEH